MNGLASCQKKPKYSGVEGWDCWVVIVVREDALPRERGLPGFTFLALLRMNDTVILGERLLPAKDGVGDGVR